MEVTKKDYSKSKIAGVEVVETNVFPDVRGTFTELFRLVDGEFFVLTGKTFEKKVFEGFSLKQSSSSILRPGLIKAFHFHKKQTDIWTVSPGCGNLQVGLIDLREDSETYKTHMSIYLGNYSTKLVRIPPGVAHGGMNIGTSDAVLTYFTDQIFDASDPDEFRLPHDHDGFEWGIPNG